MNDLKTQNDDEINIIELLQVIWDGKWKIITVSIFTLVITFWYQFIRPPVSFTATVEIKPIDSSEENRYQEFNAIDFFTVSSTLLQDLYLEQLQKRTSLEKAMREHNLLDKANFSTELEYTLAIMKVASNILIQPPVNIDDEKRGERLWTVKFDSSDENKWREIIEKVNSDITRTVRTVLQKQFITQLSIAKQKQQFETEDIDILINNSLNDYDIIVANKLAYLREQAAIARNLGVKKSTVESHAFKTQNGIITNINKNVPFYLRGYTAIEKEIDLIQSRKNKERFVTGLLELEQKKRAIEQNKTLERAEQLFALTPIANVDQFIAVSPTSNIVHFKRNRKPVLMLAIAIFIGMIIGGFYVLIENAIRKR